MFRRNTSAIANKYINYGKIVAQNESPIIITTMSTLKHQTRTHAHVSLQKASTSRLPASTIKSQPLIL